MKQTPIEQHLLNPLKKLLNSKLAGGIFLYIAVIVALVIANSPLSDQFNEFWSNKFSFRFANISVSKSLLHWINDGLMAIFFFSIGLELKREIVGGELSKPRNAILPIGAGIGGMIFPAFIYLLFNQTGAASDGWGIPMATDIAFALVILKMMGDKVPLNLKVFITVLAIADDIGAVLVIAIFYTSEISFGSLGISAIFLSIMFMGNIVGVRNLFFYGIVGLGGFWLTFSMSGIHATISGIIAAFSIPAGVKIKGINYVKKLKGLTDEFEKVEKNDKTKLISDEQIEVIQKTKIYSNAAMPPLQKIEKFLKPLIAFFIMPIFALVNSGVTFNSSILNDIVSPVTYGIIFALIFGKFIGITLVVKLLTFFKITTLPKGVNWRQIAGVGFIAGIGFTMSLFINNLAFNDPILISQAKTGILIASVVAGLTGYFILNKKTKNTISKE